MTKTYLCIPFVVSFLAVSSLAGPLATYPPGTILESVAIAPAGDLFVSDMGSGTLFRVSPSGSSEIVGTVDGPLAGIAMDVDGTVIGVAGASIYRFGPGGTVSLVADIAGAGFLNGVTILRPGVFLAADDTANRIWHVDTRTASATSWLTDPLLVPPSDGLPIGPNGIKIFDGAVYISNTGAGTILRVPIGAGDSAGAPQVYASGLFADDFAFGTDGSLLAATQIGEIIRLFPDGTREILLTGTLGDASVAFGRTAADLLDLYVVNNGGVFLGLPEGPLEASIVRLSAGIAGVAPESQIAPEPSTMGLLLFAGFVLAARWCKNRRRCGSAV